MGEPIIWAKTSADATFYGNYCPGCGYDSPYCYCPKFKSNPVSAPESAEGETNMSDVIDGELSNRLTTMRQGRQTADLYRQTLNDEASQLEIQAQLLLDKAKAKRSLASVMTREINEGVPFEEDE